MKDTKKAEEIATNRMQLLAPLLADGLDKAKETRIRQQICRQTGISERTVRRYFDAYRNEGFTGLIPKGKHTKLKEDAIPPMILEQAILLRREVPTRSVSQIIKILEWEGIVKPGHIKRSTLQEKLLEKGYSTRHMRMYAETGIAARRFQKKHRNKLWHSDIKFGPFLPIGENGAKKQVYLVTFFDDATRFMLHAQFYPTLDKLIVEDCFRQAVQKYGVPEAVFFDNGKQYKTKWMTRACSKLGIRLLFARPYSPEATGKIERFNRVVDSFLSEAALEKPQTLEKLNQLFWVWLEECYQRKPHSALGENTSPETAFRSDGKVIKFADADTITNAFLHCEQRKVDKSGCISFEGKKYEVGLNFIGYTVDVIFDPADISELTIEYKEHVPWKAKELTIGERSGERPKLPEHMTAKQSSSSRLLAAASAKNSIRKSTIPPVISYRSMKKAGEKNV